MINSKKIKERAKSMGFKQEDIATAWGIKRSTVSQKINNVRPMSLREAEILEELLEISDEEFSEYFFYSGVEQSNNKTALGESRERRTVIGGREDMDDWMFIRATLKAKPRIRPFAEAVLKAAEETGVTVYEMKSAFGMLEDMAERKLIRTEAAALDMKLPEEKE